MASETRKVFTCSIHGAILSKSTNSQTTLDIERCPKKGCKGRITSEIQVIVGTGANRLLQTPGAREETVEPKPDKEEVKQEEKAAERKAEKK